MDLYNHILLTKRPDKEYEYFWYNFKSHINNLSKYYQINCDFINTYSDNLNKLASMEKYEEIKNSIEECIIYITNIMFYKLKSHHIKLHFNFIKKWKKINDTNNNIIFFFSLYSLIIEKKNKNLLEYFKNNIKTFSDSELLLLLDYSLQNKVYYIIHKISTIYDVKCYIFDKYGFKHPNQKSITIEKFIKSFLDSQS